MKALTNHFYSNKLALTGRSKKSIVEHIGPYKINNVYCGDCVELMKCIPDSSIDIVVTSPPYDKIRDYKGNLKYDLHQTGIELFRVLKNGGIAVMVIQDQTWES